MVLELTGSISYQPNVQLFFKGFLQGVHNILKTNKEYKYVSIQGNSHNTLLLPFWNKLVIPIQRDPVCYYTYNYIVPQSPFGSHSCFMLLLNIENEKNKLNPIVLNKINASSMYF